MTIPLSEIGNLMTGKASLDGILSSALAGVAMLPDEKDIPSMHRAEYREIRELAERLDLQIWLLYDAVEGEPEDD